MSFSCIISLSKLPIYQPEDALQTPLRYLGHELVGYGLMVLEADLAGGERPLQEQTQRQLSQLGFYQSTDGLVGKGEDLLALLLPFIVLQDRGQKVTR